MTCFLTTKRAETYRSLPDDKPMVTYTMNRCSWTSLLAVIEADQWGQEPFVDSATSAQQWFPACQLFCARFIF
jgi:hypothetical protein